MKINEFVQIDQPRVHDSNEIYNLLAIFGQTVNTVHCQRRQIEVKKMLVERQSHTECTADVNKKFM